MAKYYNLHVKPELYQRIKGIQAKSGMAIMDIAENAISSFERDTCPVHRIKLPTGCPLSIGASESRCHICQTEQGAEK